jgi:hypothetical protein
VTLESLASLKSASEKGFARKFKKTSLARVEANRKGTHVQVVRQRDTKSPGQLHRVSRDGVKVADLIHAALVVFGVVLGSCRRCCEACAKLH